MIGADGFGYALGGGRHNKIPQLGIVVIENDVEIGANACVDRATVGRTVVGEGTKIDNLVQVAHNCVIGKHCVLVSQVGLAGSVRLGDYCILGARAGVADNVEVGAGSMVAGMSGVNCDLPPESKVGGLPAYNHIDWKRNLVHERHLHRTVRDFEKLKKRVAELEKRLGEPAEET
ncbi:MAG: UDP-3-O-(3-hydroxymyristoyl)glucosamine N-acyltransferase [Deltaproteobacteria bacterium]|nr:UDP-3-O-(3-hydroxymyristoyl)glucosamine N-acyltransferase [Deltaproteobacteria bacterium]